MHATRRFAFLAALATAVPVAGLSAAATPAAAAETVPIAKIQGTGDASPYAGKAVVTTGVVTAAYAKGGFDGFYLQTQGTGGDSPPAKRTASDAVFVYAPDAVGKVRVGDHVRVDGLVSEFHGLTEVGADGDGVTELSDAAEAVKPVPLDLPGEDAAREPYEGMLVRPTGGYTVSDTHNLGGWGDNAYGSITLASGDKPLRQPTDAARPGPKAKAVAADNAARRVVLDDGRSATTSSDSKVPYLTKDTPVRTGAAARFNDPMIFDYRNAEWKFQPRAPQPGGTSDHVSFENTRTDAPEQVGGDVRLANFNVLNYFTTLGKDLSGCEAYTDRDGNPLTVRGGCDARGAWNEKNLARQQGKIVAAINDLGADVVSLEEIENSAKFDKDRDAALAHLVRALNAAAGKKTWGYVKSPKHQPALAEQDVIRTAFIYKRAAVRPTGQSEILTGSEAFANAREPLAQEFRTVGGGRSFLAVANHFKSKGCGDQTEPSDGQGCYSEDRVKQAKALVGFVKDLVDKTGTADVFLLGDFNSYTQEDALNVLYKAGYTDLNSKLAHESTYVFDGKVGSLDHVLANKAATGAVTGADVWNINSVESVLTEYSRYNYFPSDLFVPDTPYRASDHDPIVVGVDRSGLARH